MNILKVLLQLNLFACTIANSITQKLFVSSYDGNITSLSLSRTHYGSYLLSVLSTTNASAPQPSWLTLDPSRRILYAVNEAWDSVNGTITSYTISHSGLLKPIATHETLSGPVHMAIYNKGKALAIAHYGPIPGVSVWSIDEKGQMKLLQTIKFTFDNQTIPSLLPQQKTPHPHQILVDPTGDFIVVPDLGADMLHIFSINTTTSELSESKPHLLPAGSGPRHGVFVGYTEHSNLTTLTTSTQTSAIDLVQESHEGSILDHYDDYSPVLSNYRRTRSGLTTRARSSHLILLSEISSEISTWQVVYENGTDLMIFHPTFNSSIYRDFESSQPTQSYTFPAEIYAAPDNMHILTSSRNDSTFRIPNFDSTNQTQLVSDTMQSWNWNSKENKLEFKQLSASWGMNPRHFSANKDGTLVAIATQLSSRIVIVGRDPLTGLMGAPIANIEALGQVNCVVWDEK